MFSLCMLESAADEVTLQGVTGVGLKHALDFAYTGQVSLERAAIRARNTRRWFLLEPQWLARRVVVGGGKGEVHPRLPD